MQRFNVLQGFVELIEVMGNDHSIPAAARICTGCENEKGPDVERDRKLIRYLMRHQHWTPFEMAELKFRILCPMDVWRQWIRHRTASVNEYSTRYSNAIERTATTEAGAWRKASNTRRQGSADEMLPEEKGIELSRREVDFLEEAKSVYHERLAAGVAREQARKDLPLSTFTEAIWKIDLRNLFHFLKLRMSKEAQLEIRQYANAVALLTQSAFPICYEAFLDFELNATTLTAVDVQCLASLLSGAGITEDRVRELWCDRFGCAVPSNQKDSEREEFIKKLAEIGVING